MDALNNALKLFKFKHIRITSLGIVLMFLFLFIYSCIAHFEHAFTCQPISTRVKMGTSPNSTFTISVLPPLQEIALTPISSNLIVKVILLEKIILKE